MNRPSDDLNRQVEDLIDDLDKLNEKQTSVTNPRANTIAVITAIGKFSCILSVLSRKAEDQTRKIAHLTWGLLFLTIVLLLVALTQLGIMIIEHGSKAP